MGWLLRFVDFVSWDSEPEGGHSCPRGGAARLLHHPRLALEHRFVLLAWGTTRRRPHRHPASNLGRTHQESATAPRLAAEHERARSQCRLSPTGRSGPRLRGETACHAPLGRRVPPVAERLTPPATSGEAMQRSTAHVLSTNTGSVPSDVSASRAGVAPRTCEDSVPSTLPRGVDAPWRLRRRRSKGARRAPPSKPPAAHGPREAWASTGTPAQVPRHQPARHPHSHVRPAKG